jgi:hypothetical protein
MARTHLPTWALLSIALLAAPVTAAPEANEPATGETVTIVKVERVKPTREKFATLRFLRANRDFIRARFDRLRQESRTEAQGAGDLDPRFIEYRKLLAQIATAKDSVQVAALARERASLFASVSDLATLERELDQMERFLESQRLRLAVLQADFAGRQRTELDVLVAGSALAGVLDSVVVTLEDGSRLHAGLNDTQRESLRHGGVLEVFRGLVEPREQVLEITFHGEGWSLTGPGYVTLEPQRDQLTFLKLDLAQAHPSRGLSSVVAGMWCLDPSVPPLPLTTPQPSAESQPEAP